MRGRRGRARLLSGRQNPSRGILVDGSSAPIQQNGTRSVSMPMPTTEAFRPIPRISFKRKRVGEEGTPSSASSLNSENVRRRSPGSARATASMHNDAEPALKRKKREVGPSNVESSYSLRGRRGKMSPLEESDSANAGPSRSSEVLLNREISNLSEDHQGADTNSISTNEAIEAEIATPWAEDEPENILNPAIQTMRLKRQGKKSLVQRTLTQRSFSGLNSAQLSPSHQSPAPDTPQNELSGVAENIVAKSRRRPPGRKRKPNANDEIEAALRRQLHLKTAYRGVIKALKPLLGELAQRSIDDLDEEEDAHKKHQAQYDSVMAELDRRRDLRLKRLDGKLEEELAHFERQFKNGKAYLELQYRDDVDRIREASIARCCAKSIGDYKIRRKNEEDDLTEDEYETPLEPLRAAAAFAVTNKRDPKRFLEEKYESRSRPYMQIENYTDRETRRARLAPLICDWTARSREAETTLHEGLLAPLRERSPILSVPPEQEPSHSLLNAESNAHADLSVLVQALASDDLRAPTRMDVDTETLSQSPVNQMAKQLVEETHGLDALLEAIEIKQASQALQASQAPEPLESSSQASQAPEPLGSSSQALSTSTPQLTGDIEFLPTGSSGDELLQEHILSNATLANGVTQSPATNPSVSQTNDPSDGESAETNDEEVPMDTAESSPTPTLLDNTLWDSDGCERSIDNANTRKKAQRQDVSRPMNRLPLEDQQNSPTQVKSALEPTPIARTNSNAVHQASKFPEDSRKSWLADTLKLSFSKSSPSLDRRAHSLTGNNHDVNLFSLSRDKSSNASMILPVPINPRFGIEAHPRLGSSSRTNPPALNLNNDSEVIIIDSAESSPSCKPGSNLLPGKSNSTEHSSLGRHDNRNATTIDSPHVRKDLNDSINAISYVPRPDWKVPARSEDHASQGPGAPGYRFSTGDVLSDYTAPSTKLYMKPTPYFRQSQSPPKTTVLPSAGSSTSPSLVLAPLRHTVATQASNADRGSLASRPSPWQDQSAKAHKHETGNADGGNFASRPSPWHPQSAKTPKHDMPGRYKSPSDRRDFASPAPPPIPWATKPLPSASNVSPVSIQTIPFPSPTGRPRAPSAPEAVYQSEPYNPSRIENQASEIARAQTTGSTRPSRPQYLPPNQYRPPASSPSHHPTALAATQPALHPGDRRMSQNSINTVYDPPPRTGMGHQRESGAFYPSPHRWAGTQAREPRREVNGSNQAASSTSPTVPYRPPPPPRPPPHPPSASSSSPSYSGPARQEGSRFEPGWYGRRYLHQPPPRK